MFRFDKSNKPLGCAQVWTDQCYLGSILLVLVIINRGQILIGDMVNYIGDILNIGDLVKIGDRQKDRQKYWRF